MIAPQILPANMPPIPAEKCKVKLDGKAVLSLLVDTAGHPRNIMFLHPLGTDLDKLALRIVAAERFTPATSDGTPVVVAETAEVNMQSCLEQDKDSLGRKTYLLRLRSGPLRKYEILSAPEQQAVLSPEDPSWQDSVNGSPRTEHVGGPVTQPFPLNSVEAEFTQQARDTGIQGKCLIRMVVDRQGMPQNIEVVKSLDPGLDQNAVFSVGRYRFKPAMRNGEPVPVIITVEVNFRLG